MTELEEKIYEIVRLIPEGKVATYGRIAEILGNVRLSRVVGNAMHKNPVPFVELARDCGYTGSFEVRSCLKRVPCHRVVNGKGFMGTNFGLGGPEVQERMLKREGVSVCNGKVNLEQYGCTGLWNPLGSGGNC